MADYLFLKDAGVGSYTECVCIAILRADIRREQAFGETQIHVWFENAHGSGKLASCTG